MFTREIFVRHWCRARAISVTRVLSLNVGTLRGLDKKFLTKKKPQYTSYAKMPLAQGNLVGSLNVDAFLTGLDQ